MSGAVKGNTTMTFHPEFAPIIEALQPTDWMGDVNATRAFMATAAADTTHPDDPTIAVSDMEIPSDTGPTVRIRYYRPAGASTTTPTVLWCHGGGFALGTLDTEDANCRKLVRRYQLTVVSVDYRLAPEHPYPAGFNDAYQALLWTARTMTDRQGHRPPLAVGGHSAGAALAAAVALAARDRGGPDIAFVYLGYPVLHDAPTTASFAAASDPRIWNSDQARAAWRLYLAGHDPAPPYAAPARADTLDDFPATYMLVCQTDPHRDEALEFADRLIAAGVLLELHLLPGAPHMFDTYAPNGTLTNRAVDGWVDALGQTLTRTPPTV